ncbi:MAG: hypothetical protein ACR2M1_08470 [Gemmatimonadaceae bacterium]
MSSNPFFAATVLLLIPAFAFATGASVIVFARTIRYRVWDSAAFMGIIALVFACLTTLMTDGARQAYIEQTQPFLATTQIPKTAPSARASNTASVRAVVQSLAICHDQGFQCRVGE